MTFKKDPFSDNPHIYLAYSGEGDPFDRWEFTDETVDELNKLSDLDPQGYDYLISTAKRIARRGARLQEKADYREPIGRLVRARYGQNFPWLGELKESETEACKKPGKFGRSREYRLYFLDIDSLPQDPQFMMLASMYAEKYVSPSRRDQKRVQGRQNHDISKAINRGIIWCGENKREYRRG